MWKLILFTFTLPGLFPLFADPGAHEYYDRTAWENAVANRGTLEKDNFNSDSISLSSVSVASYISYNGLHAGSGHFSGGAWEDTIPKYGYTQWTFSRPIYAFGANFQMDVDDGLGFFSGLNLSMPNAVRPYVNDGRKRHFDGFYGVVSTTPIRSLFISWGSDGPPCSCYRQSYVMDNLEISTTPADTPVPGNGTKVPRGLEGPPSLLFYLPQHLP